MNDLSLFVLGQKSDYLGINYISEIFFNKNALKLSLNLFFADII